MPARHKDVMPQRHDERGRAQSRMLAAGADTAINPLETKP
jgi:hypothetical protein